jgi:DNA-binding NarL/FixJ family response regulator
MPSEQFLCVPKAPPAADDFRILIVKADRFCAAALRQATQSAFPRARITGVASIADARKELRTSDWDFLVTGVALPDGDVLDLLASPEKRACPRTGVLVVTATPHLHMIENLSDQAVTGVFDTAREDPEDLPFALMGVALGYRCWSANLLEELAAARRAVPQMTRRLTLTEQLVLATVADGCDDRIAAGRLGVKPASVQSVRRRLHRKLGVQHKGQLVTLAAQHGCVRFTPHGVLRPGYELLLQAYRARKQKRAANGAAEVKLAAD